MFEKRQAAADSREAASAQPTGDPQPSEPVVSEASAEAKPDEKQPKGRHKKDKVHIEELTQAVEAAEAAKATLQDRLLRLQADFDNYRKRSARERTELFRLANEDLMNELLPVVDHFDLALSAADAARQDNPLAQGVRMVREQLSTALSKFGLQPLSAEGQTFDPSRHEAISHLPSETVPENGVIAQTRRGYLLGDKLLRAAQVVVSSGSPGAPPPAAQAESVAAEPPTGKE